MCDMKMVEKARCVCRSSAKCAYCMMRDGQLTVRKAANGVVDPDPGSNKPMWRRLIDAIATNFRISTI